LTYRDKTFSVRLTVTSMDYMDMDLGKAKGDTEDSAYMVMDIHKSIANGMDYMEMGPNTIGNTSQESLLGGCASSSFSGCGSWRGEDLISSSLPNSHVLPPTIQVTRSEQTSVIKAGPILGSSVSAATSCVSLHRSQSHSPVSRFSKLLRNSFSKLKSRTVPKTSLRSKSRSIDVLKKVCNEEDDYSETATDVINEAINEEMVIQSTRQGLPIIPFPCPNFVIADKNFEDTKVLIRENSYKDFEASVNHTINSLHCDSDTPLPGLRETRKNEPSSEKTQRSKFARNHEYNSQSSYVEMAPGCGHSSSQPIPSQSYVMMEARLPRLTQPPASTLRREAEADTEEPIFHLEQMGAVKGDTEPPLELPSPCDQWSLHQLHRGRQQTDSISPLSLSDQRKYKKGNKHKGDYCFVDLGLESGSSGEQKKRSSSFSHSNRSWKTFNKK